VVFFYILGAAHMTQSQGPTEPALNQRAGKLIYLQFDLLQRASAKGSLITSSKGEAGRRPKSDILGRTFIPSLNQPPLPAQRATNSCSGPQLAVLFGFSTNKGECRRSVLGESQPW
jgi:hypothetical protein